MSEKPIWVKCACCLSMVKVENADLCWDLRISQNWPIWTCHGCHE